LIYESLASSNNPIVCRKTVAQSQTSLNKFQENTATRMSEFSGRIETLLLAGDALSISGVMITQQDVTAVTQILNEHGKLLKQCLLFCTSAMNAAQPKTDGTYVKYAEAVEQAKQIIGNVGEIRSDAPNVTVDKAKAGGSSFQFIGRMSKEALGTLVNSTSQ
jgi:hypothetical protein